MDLVGEFHKVEIDGKLFLVYHNVLKPLPQVHTRNSSDKIAIDSGDDLPLQPLFVCPSIRMKSAREFGRSEGSYNTFSKVITSPLFDATSNGHHILPLFWCNNEEADPDYECRACQAYKVGADFYFCVKCHHRYHKGCVESPIEINYPSHVNHSLQLHISQLRFDECIFCKGGSDPMVYYCTLCDIYMHAVCAQEPIPFFLDQPKRHDHILTLFPRQAFLTCNVCGLINKLHLTYVCPLCDFVAHSECIFIPQTIRISRHHHRISFISSVPFKEGSCGVCRRKVDGDYGAYTCKMCSGYVVHTRCALRTDIWDGIELEGVPEEDEDDKPFERISDGIILHFSHGHHLRFEVSKVYDGNKFCQACVRPIYEGNFYSCVECKFILHETCTNASRKNVHPLHPHPLKLQVVHMDGIFFCFVCKRLSSGFVYECVTPGCHYQIDAHCASASEPFIYQGHQHPLFLALDPRERPVCHVCKSMKSNLGYEGFFNCIECDFIICFKCATQPYMVRYKHDEHYLTFCRGDEASDADWCELCEGKLVIGGGRGFYKCNDCCTTLHIDCLLGDEPHLKPGHTIEYNDGDYEMHVLQNNSPSRPTCFTCHRLCPYPVFLAHEKSRFCSIICVDDHLGIYQ